MTIDERDAMLNDYVDGLLRGEALDAFERELEMDPSLRQEAHALRELLHEAAKLPASIEPERDLWKGIEERIAHRGGPGGVTPFPRRRAPFWAGLSTLAAAAAVTLVAGLSYWNQKPQPESLPTVAVAIEATPSTEGEGLMAEWKLAQEKADEAYRQARAGLLDALEARRDSLPPETEAVLRETMAVVDNAVNELTVALADDPQNPALLNMLVATREKELNVLEQIVSGPQGL
ncbi:MAG: hypothetical protein RLZZ303_743 [Candidatus Hydrogenedentota bacterium]|jgi:tetratricopeptide (TPR) repeat protein